MTYRDTARAYAQRIARAEKARNPRVTVTIERIGR